MPMSRSGILSPDEFLVFYLVTLASRLLKPFSDSFRRIKPSTIERVNILVTTQAAVVTLIVAQTFDILTLKRDLCDYQKVHSVT